MQIHTPILNCYLYVGIARPIKGIAISFHKMREIEYRQHDDHTIFETWDQYRRYIPILYLTSEDIFRLKREMKHEVNNVDDPDYQNLFISKPALRPEYCNLFEHQCFYARSV